MPRDARANEYSYGRMASPTDILSWVDGLRDDTHALEFKAWNCAAWLGHHEASEDGGRP